MQRTQRTGIDPYCWYVCSTSASQNSKSTLQLGVQAGIEEEEGLKGDTNEYNEEANDNKDSLNFLLPIGV